MSDIEKPQVVGAATEDAAKPAAVAPAESSAPFEAASNAAAIDKNVFAKFFPRSYTHVLFISLAFVVALVATTVPQGMSYERFITRSQNCYTTKGYYKKAMGGCSGTGDNAAKCEAHNLLALDQAKACCAGDAATCKAEGFAPAPCTWTPGTLDDPLCAVFSYPYRLLTPTVGSRFIPWAAYLLHQLGQWWFLRQAQLARDRGEIKWTLQSELVGKSREEQARAYAPNKYARNMFALNMGMVLLKFVQSQATYDGLASDVPEFSALYSVALWILFVMIVEMPRRGLVFGYWKSFDFKWNEKSGLGRNFIPFIRKYHGYGISFGTTYNFWYHPMEGSPGFVLGYLYQFCMILQSSFLFHPLHRNKFWTLLLELGVVPHSILIAIFFANGNPGSAFQFGFGFAFAFIITQMHGFDLKVWQKCGFAVGYLATLIVAYVAVGRPLSNIVEVARMAITFLFAPLTWAIWVFCTLLLIPFRGIVEKHSWTCGAFWFAVWLAQIVVFIIMGATTTAGGTGGYRVVAPVGTAGR